MSEKDNFSDLAGNRSSQSASSDFTNKRPQDDELDSYESLDFYDSTDFSSPSDFSDDNADTVNELIEVTEVTKIAPSSDDAHRNFSITGPDDELDFVAREEHIAREKHENYEKHEAHKEPHETPEDHDALDENHPAPAHPHRPDPDFVARPPRYSHRPVTPAPTRMISDFQPVSKRAISTTSIHSSGKKSKPEFADDIITISAFETASTEEPKSNPDHHDHDAEVFKSQPTSTPRDTKSRSTKPKAKKSNHFVVGLLCVIIALIVAGVGIAVAVKLINDSKSQPAKVTIEEPTTPIITDDNTALSFLQLENDEQNLIYSPLSIRSGLALLNAGADGSTKTQISKVLGSSAVPQYQSVEDELSLANGIFIRDSYRDSILNSYIDTVTDNQNAQLIFGDLTADLVNQWAKDNTLGLIDNLGVTPTEDTKVILANALAIKMDWEYQFKSADTRDRDFYTVSGKKISVPTMSRTFTTDDVYYATDEDKIIVSLPLSSKSTADLEFVAIMPDDDLADYIEDLTPTELQKTLDSLTPASDTTDGVEVNIPKFKFDYELDFQKDLEKLGITSAFNAGTANFSKLSTSRLYVSDAVHKANIDFSESGIEAAAVTTFSLDISAMAVEDEPLVKLTFDHPFLFVIRDRANDTVWFTGTVYTPSAD